MRPICMRKLGLLALAATLAAGSVGCDETRRGRGPYPGQYPGQYNPGQYNPNGQYNPGGYPPGQAPPQQGQAQGQANPWGGWIFPGWGTGTGQPQGQPPQGQQGQPTQGPPSSGGFVGNDPINNVDTMALRARAGAVLTELKTGLRDADRNKVASVPLFADPTAGEVNAFAACDDQGQPLMAISDSLLEVMAFSARFKATDELFGTRKLDGYTSMVASEYQPKKPMPRPAASFIDPAQDNDSRKIARQNQLLDEQLAFVLGHELAHHYLGHTGCANGGGSRGIGAGDFGRLMSRAIPGLNQQAEVSADVSGTNNLLAVGTKRSGTKWNEEGALLSLGFFAALDRLTPEKVLFSFESSHPPPQLRMPIVSQTANTFRMTGGNGLPIPFSF